uniref:Uncharacterized protein n=1 Tax=Arion vulgaris TaxID=1028688 RepID=A0A0B6Z3J0_9EUPU
MPPRLNLVGHTRITWSWQKSIIGTCSCTTACKAKQICGNTTYCLAMSIWLI